LLLPGHHAIDAVGILLHHEVVDFLGEIASTLVVTFGEDEPSTVGSFLNDLLLLDLVRYCFQGALLLVVWVLQALLIDLHVGYDLQLVTHRNIC